MLHAYVRWVHHLLFDPISTSEAMIGWLFFTVPLLFIGLVLKAVFDYWYDNYYDN